MAINAADFKAAYPAFNSTQDSEVNAALAEAQDLFRTTERGVFLLTAHLLTINADGFDAETTAERVGEQAVSVKAQAETGRDAFYTSTLYGRRFLAHRNARKGMAAYAV